MEPLLDDIYAKGPKSFRKSQLAKMTADALFRARSALIYTATDQLPPEVVGSGELSVTLPLAFPTTFEFMENRTCWNPRMWLDLIQRQTGKIRWTPIESPVVEIVRYDPDVFAPQNLKPGDKGLLDAVKFKTTGRRDARNLYYFGAILDDSPSELAELQVSEERIASYAESRTTIRVRSRE